jgi:putative ABC transport system permease protein
MTFLLRIWAIFVIAVKRLWAQKGLALATLLGLVVTIALALSIPLYADAVYFRVLREELSQTTLAVGTTARSPFAFMFRYIGAWNGLISLEDVQPVDQYLSGPVIAQLRLPQQAFTRYFKTDNFRLFPIEDLAYADTKDPLAWVNFGFVTGIENHIAILEGGFPAEAAPSPDSTVEVLMSEELALELGLQVGETYMTFTRMEIEGVERTVQIPIQIVGIWRATDPTDSFWFYTPETLEELLLVPEKTFLDRISPYMDGEIALALWYLLMDGSDVHAADAGPLLSRINAIQQRTSALLPGTSLDVSPADALYRYQRGAALLTILLYAFSVPILALILTFTSLVVNLSVGRQRNEIAVLRSRGATIGQVLGIAALEGVLMGSMALVIGLPVGEMIAQVIGQTQSFLNFTGNSDLRVDITMATLRFGFIAVGLALVAQIMPTFGAARHTIVSYKQNQARSLRPPWWQRAWLDVLLLVPAVYGAYLLRQQGSIVLPVGEQEVINNSPFQNPLLLLVPALGILALTLVFLRLLPFLMTVLAWIISHFGGVGLLLATRQLSRTPGFYTAPMILLVLTLSLSAFTASLARTLDNHLYDQAYYEIGADMNMVDFGQSSESGGGFGALGAGAPEGETGEDAEAAVAEEEAGPRWFFLPVTEYLKAPGVLDATRVGKYGASTRLSGSNQTGVFMGVDRVNFPAIAFWRWDFAPSYLADLMNALAISPDGVLLPRDFMSQHSLRVGDTIQVEVAATGQRVTMSMKVVGGFDYFPTWYPTEEGALFVGNLDYFFEQAGGQFPYNVWLKTEPGVDYNKIVEEARNLQLTVLDSDAALLTVNEAQKDPERQGLFGLLSVGFGAAALLTILGFILYALFSFRQRFIELGVLRAIGLSSVQMTIFLAWELAFLILTGLLLGTGLGVWASQLFIPYLQVGPDPTALTPPFLVEIAWPAIFRIYGLFGLLFVAALAVLASLLLRMKIFQAVKLGETV